MELKFFSLDSFEDIDFFWFANISAVLDVGDVG